MGDAGNTSEILLSHKDKRVHPYDFAPSQNNGYEGGKFAKPIQAWLTEHGISLPSEPQLLGLGAGIANPECALADQLGIDYPNVTLVDKSQSVPDNPIFRNREEDIAYVTHLGAKHRAAVNYRTGRGIFHYLEKPDRRDFSVVTAIGLEYLLHDPAVMQDFIRALPNVLLPNAFVCVYPEGSNNPESVWSENGFAKVELNPNDYSHSLLYVYANPVRQ